MQATQILSYTKPNTIDFGRIYVEEKKTKKIILSNTGKFSYDFNWSFSALPPAVLTQIASSNLHGGSLSSSTSRDTKIFSTTPGNKPIPAPNNTFN